MGQNIAKNFKFLSREDQRYKQTDEFRCQYPNVTYNVELKTLETPYIGVSLAL